MLVTDILLSKTSYPTPESYISLLGFTNLALLVKTPQKSNSSYPLGAFGSSHILEAQFCNRIAVHPWVVSWFPVGVLWLFTRFPACTYRIRSLAEATQLSSCVRTFPSNEVQQYPDGYSPLCRPVVWRHFPHIHIHLLCGVMYSNRYVKFLVGSSVPLSSNLTTDWPPTNPDREQSTQKHIRRLARLTMDPPVQQCLPITQGINSGSFSDGRFSHVP